MKLAATLLSVALLAGCGKSDSSSPSSSSSSGTPTTPSSTSSSSTSERSDPDKSLTPARDLKRPALQMHQGQYFRWAMPKGWDSNETTNGVDLAATDGSAGIGFSMVLGGYGEMTPEKFLKMSYETLQLTDIKVLKRTKRPDEPGFGGVPWTVVEHQTSRESAGKTWRGQVLCGVQDVGGGRYNAGVFYAFAVEPGWEEKKLWLLPMGQQIAITNTREVAQLDKFVYAKNNPMDHDVLTSAWKAKGLSEDRIAQAQRERMMGYEEMESPTTGERYQMPLESYDGTLGGYRNPEKPEELLKKPRND